jgi:hypothetical protein
LQGRLDTTQQTLHSYRREDALPVPPQREIVAEVTLLPLSVFLRKGYRLQLVLASGDSATFAAESGFAAVISSSSTLTLPISVLTGRHIH